MTCFLWFMKYNHKGKRDYAEKGKHFLPWLPAKMGEVILCATFYNDLNLCTAFFFPDTFSLSTNIYVMRGKQNLQKCIHT